MPFNPRVKNELNAVERVRFTVVVSGYKQTRYHKADSLHVV